MGGVDGENRAGASKKEGGEGMRVDSNDGAKSGRDELKGCDAAGISGGNAPENGVAVSAKESAAEDPPPTAEAQAQERSGTDNTVSKDDDGTGSAEDEAASVGGAPQPAVEDEVEEEESEGGGRKKKSDDGTSPERSPNDAGESLFGDSSASERNGGHGEEEALDSSNSDGTKGNMKSEEFDTSSDSKRLEKMVGLQFQPFGRVQPVLYVGTVVDVGESGNPNKPNEVMFKVQYEDGDREDMTLVELKKFPTAEGCTTLCPRMGYQIVKPFTPLGTIVSFHKKYLGSPHWYYKVEFDDNKHSGIEISEDEIQSFFETEDEDEGDDDSMADAEGDNDTPPEEPATRSRRKSSKKKRKFASKKTDASRKRQRSCSECVGCLTPNCGLCRYCKDMPKFGGPGELHQKCEKRKCEAMKKSANR